MDDLLFGKTVLVTGSTGLLGNAVAKMLLHLGCQLRAMARNPSAAQPLANLGAEIVQADMTDLQSLERAVTGCQAVLHFAGVLAGDSFSPSYFHRVNVEGTQRLAEAALAAGTERFIFASTCWVYGYAASPSTTERSPYRISKDLYVDTKIEAERCLQELRLAAGLPLVIVQPSEVYGPGDRHWTLTPLRMLKAGQMVMVAGGKGLIQPIYIDDAVTGILAALRCGRIGEAYLLVGPEVVSLRQYYTCFAQMLHRRRIASIPVWMAMGLATVLEGVSKATGKPPLFSRPLVRGNTMQATYDGCKARDELGFLPQVNLEAGMRQISAWLKAENPLGQA